MIPSRGANKDDMKKWPRRNGALCDNVKTAFHFGLLLLRQELLSRGHRGSHAVASRVGLVCNANSFP